MDIRLVVFEALKGQVPPTLRFLYATLDKSVLSVRAVFESAAPKEHIEAVDVAVTEMLAACPLGTQLDWIPERSDDAPWKVGDAEGLMFLRYGELSDT